MKVSFVRTGLIGSQRLGSSCFPRVKGLERGACGGFYELDTRRVELLKLRKGLEGRRERRVRREEFLDLNGE